MLLEGEKMLFVTLAFARKMKKNIKNNLIAVALMLVLVSLFACDRTRVYEEWQDMKHNQWHADSVCTFTFEVQDSLLLYDLNFGIRHTNLYPYQNIWLIIDVEGGKNEFVYQDTIQMVLANKNGKWFGKRSASIYTYASSLYRQLPFYSAGGYTFRIQHGMRKETLNGVSSIGFRIETSE